MVEISGSPGAGEANRNTALDLLRFAAVLSIVYWHAGMPYGGIYDWFGLPKDGHKMADRWLWITFGFRLQLFFLISGYFACIIYTRLGAARAFRLRLQRLGVPLVVGVALTHGMVALITGFMVPQAPGADGVVPALSRTPHLYQFWFIYYLLIMTVLALVVAEAARRVVRAAARRTAADSVARFLSGGLAPLLLASVTALLIFGVNAGPARGFFDPSFVPSPIGTPEIRPLVLAFYGFPFVVGWLIGLRPALLQSYREHWIWLVLLALMVRLLSLHLLRIPDRGPDFALLMACITAVFIWSACTGLIGFFQVIVRRDRPLFRYLADSGYWIFSIHLLLLVFLKAGLDILSLPPLASYLSLISLTTILALASYEAFVRYGPIGRVLHGARQIPVRGRSAAWSLDLYPAAGRV